MMSVMPDDKLPIRDWPWDKPLPPRPAPHRSVGMDPANDPPPSWQGRFDRDGEEVGIRPDPDQSCSDCGIPFRMHGGIRSHLWTASPIRFGGRDIPYVDGGAFVVKKKPEGEAT